MSNKSHPSISGECVKEYIKKFPSIPSMRLAKVIYENEKELFNNIECVRSAIRYYRGATGDNNRKYLLKENYLPRFEIPEPDEECYEPYIFAGQFPIIVFSDLHVPYYDLDALDICLERAYGIGAKSIIIDGDFFDCYLLSRWIKDPRKRSMKDELDIGKNIFKTIRNSFPNITIIFKYGNHEERYDDYIKLNAPAIFDLEHTRLKDQLEIDKYKIDIVMDKRIIKIQHLHIIHGNEYGRSMTNPVNPARGLYMRAKKTSLCGHYHQSSEHTESSINNDIVTCWSIGCLSGLHPEYLPLNKWNHGFAEIYNDEDYFTVHNRKIINYKLV
jgi:hypothetical protein